MTLEQLNNNLKGNIKREFWIFNSKESLDKGINPIKKVRTLTVYKKGYSLWNNSKRIINKEVKSYRAYGYEPNIWLIQIQYGF